MTLSHYARPLHFAVVKVYFEQLISEHVLDKSWLGIIVYHIQHARVR